MREELTACSSVVLFGHEHFPDTTLILTKFGDHVRILDGGALSGHEQAPSSFNLLLLDTKVGRVKSFVFHNMSGRYEQLEGADWQDATRLTSSESGRFRLTAATCARLEDIGANILHPRQDRVSLRDLFVYPDLLPLNTDFATIQEKLERPISAETLIFNSEISHALLEGENSSGKSALLKMYFSEFYQRGKIPLLLRGGKSAFRGSDALRALIKRSYHATYVGEDYTQFEQLQPSERVLLIDEFEFAGANEESHEDVFKFLHQFSDKCIVVT